MREKIMENSTDNKVLGIEVSKYTNICYLLMLISGGFGLLTSLGGLGNVNIPGSSIIGLLGLAGLVLALLGLFAFKDKFSSLDLSHFKYVGVLLVIFIIIFVVLGSFLFNEGFVGALLVLLLSAAHFVLLFAGFRTYKAGIEASKDAIITNIKSGLKG
jgi:hypothetical protein